MIYNRGQPADLDNWAQRGNRGWGYDDVLPYYRRTERRIGHRRRRQARRARAASRSPTWTGSTRSRRPSSPAASAIGHPAQPRLQQRRPGRRRLLPAHDPARPPGQRRARLPAPGACAAPASRCGPTRAPAAILFEGKRAVGVRYLRERGGPAREVRARREVILSAGTVNTARLLQISGVGPADAAGRARRAGRARAAAASARTSATITPSAASCAPSPARRR